MTFGDDDIIQYYEKNKNNADDDNKVSLVYTKKTICKTETGMLLAIRINDFIKKVQRHADTWDYLLQSIKIRNKQHDK